MSSDIILLSRAAAKLPSLSWSLPQDFLQGFTDRQKTLKGKPVKRTQGTVDSPQTQQRLDYILREYHLKEIIKF